MDTAGEKTMNVVGDYTAYVAVWLICFFRKNDIVVGFDECNCFIAEEIDL